MRIDAHQHFWRLARADYDWMGTSETLAPLRRDVLPQDYPGRAPSYGIGRTVLVQAAPTVFETEYLLGLADATPWIATVVGWVDFEDPSHRRHLERFAMHPKFAGVRPMIQDIPDPDWMHREDVQWAYRALIDLDLAFDALGFPVHLERFLRLFERYPDMRTVIDHGMKPQIRDRAFDDWAAAMSRIAEATPVFCKLSGLVTEAAADWTVEDLRPYAELILSAFGPERVMWGSDWPVVDLAGGFAPWWSAAEALVPAEHREAVFGATAARFYRLG